MDQYYGKEEEIETPATQIDNLQAQASAIQAADTWSVEQLGTVYDKTLELWNTAAERGDVETQNGLTEIYKGAERMQQTLTQTNAAMKSVLEAAQALTKQKQAIESELEELTEAVSNAEPDHPLVRDLIEMVEQNAYEYAGEGMYEDAWEGATESIYEDFYSTLRRLSPASSYFTMERVISALRGEEELNDVQRGLVLSLIQSFTVETKKS